jgi:site-specific DNA-methyltransferase (adenine-specific)
MGYHYRARYELILFFEKGKRKLNDLGIADIIEEPRIFRGYPAEKPSRVSSVLIGQSTEPGEIVADPFMGSGSVGVAAVELGRHFVGNDICAEAIDIARARLVDGGGRERAAADDPLSTDPARVIAEAQRALELRNPEPRPAASERRAAPADERAHKRRQRG